VRREEALMQSAKATLLCAIRFWGVTPGVPTLRRGVRHVARKQGLTPADMDRAERQLIRAGLVQRSGKRMGAAIVLTPKGMRVSARACPYVHLPPWRPYPHHMAPGAKA
jgi:DNA-binding MarR family transcriptional regulator